jgi:hypothetical protein
MKAEIGQVEIDPEKIAEVLEVVLKSGQTPSEAVYLLVTATAHVLSYTESKEGAFYIDGYNIKYQADEQPETIKQH